MRGLHSLGNLDTAVRQSHERPIVLFKDRLTCGRSGMALHESPQALVVHRGVVAWHASHSRVTPQNIAPALAAVASSSPTV